MILIGSEWAMLLFVIHVFLDRAPYTKETLSDFC